MKNVLLVFGGKSYEHDISVVTAIQILKKTKLDDVKLVLLYVSRDGDFFVCDDKTVRLEDFSKEKFSKNNRCFKQVIFVGGEKGKLFVKTRFGLKEYLRSNIAIFACHGGDGENGKLVSYFEHNGVCCSAGNFDALAVCMNKFLFKNVAKGLKIPVVSGFLIRKENFEKQFEKFLVKTKKYGFPVIIKINSGGSSIGLFVAESENDFKEKLSAAFEFDDEVIVEKFIRNTREFNVAILGDYRKYAISEIDEPIKNNEILSFADKYLAGNSKCSKKSMASSFRKFPAQLPTETEIKIKQYAEKLFVFLGLTGIVRFDFLFDETNKKLYICEANTIPGSLAFYFFKRNRVLCNDLILRLIEIAENKQNSKVFNMNFCCDILKK